MLVQTIWVFAEMVTDCRGLLSFPKFCSLAPKNMNSIYGASAYITTVCIQALN